MPDGIDDQTRRQVLAEWRGYWEPRRKPERCRPVADTVGAVMRKWGLSERLMESDVQASWRQIVGEFLAEHSQPVSLRHGRLVVQVLQPTVHYELKRLCAGHILTELKRRFGRTAISEVRFQLG